MARAVSTAPTRASHSSAASTSPRARCARTPVSRYGNRQAASMTSAEAWYPRSHRVSAVS